MNSALQYRISSLVNFDNIIITDIYAAREQFDGVTKASDLTMQIRNDGKDAVYIEDFSQVEEYLRENVEENDMVFIMGAGDVIEIGKAVAKK